MNSVSTLVKGMHLTSIPRAARLKGSGGPQSALIARSIDAADDKNEIVIAFDTKDTKMAKDFAASPDLKEAMMKAGVVDVPTIYFLEAV